MTDDRFDRFDNFPLMADKIQVRGTHKGFVVWCFVELWSPIKTREIVRQVIFFESKGFHVGNVVTADFFRFHGFRNVSLLVVPGHRPSSLQMTSKW